MSGGVWGEEGQRVGQRHACCLPGGVVGPGSVKGPRGWGVGSRSSVPLPLLHGHQGWLRLRRLGHGGCGLHTAPVHVRVLLPGRCLRAAPGGVLLLRQATGGPGRQGWGSATARGGGRCRPAGVSAAACRGYGESGGVTARGRGARGHGGVRGAALGPRCRGAAVLLASGRPGGCNRFDRLAIGLKPCA